MKELTSVEEAKALQRQLLYEMKELGVSNKTITNLKRIAKLDD